MKYFEDVRVGDKLVVGRHTFTAEEIKSFAERFDPQPFHLDEAAGARSQFGALCASGWHTVVMWMRLRIDQQNLKYLQELLRKGATTEKAVREGERQVEVGAIAVAKAQRTLRSWRWTSPTWVSSPSELPGRGVSPSGNGLLSRR